MKVLICLLALCVTQSLAKNWRKNYKNQINKVNKYSKDELMCKDESGNPVDWYVAYKLPKIKNEQPPFDSGFAYLYVTDTSPAKKKVNGSNEVWTLSEYLVTDPRCMMAKTIEPLLPESNSDAQFTYVVYNDSPPDMKTHAKGVLAVDGNTGFWIIHSVPHYFYPFNQSYQYPDSGDINGQTILCISIKTKDSVADVVNQLYYMRPNIYSYQVTKEVVKYAPMLQKLIKKKWPKDVNSVKRTITSYNGKEFTSFSKGPNFGMDLYSDLVAPDLKSDLLVQTWRRGAGTPLKSNCSGDYTVVNVDEVRVDFEEGRKIAKEDWPYTEDHSKWTITADETKQITCIGDINRMKSQFKRGGGTTCFDSSDVWQKFKEAAEGLEGCGNL